VLPAIQMGLRKTWVQMNSPVSILFPCYQLNNWLVDALESIEIAGRKLESECVIIANNMSSHDLVALKKICAEMMTINYKIEDAGQTNLVGALNFGIKKCNFNLIARMDQDDVMLPERLVIQRNYLDSHPAVAIVGGATQIIDEVGEFITTQTYPTTSDQIKFQIKRGNCFAHPAVMYRKDAVDKVGLYRNIFTHAEDFDLFVRLSREYKCANLDIPVIKYRLNSNQVSKRFRKAQITSTRSLIVLQGIEKCVSSTRFPLPPNHSQLAEWLQKLRNYSIKSLLSVHHADRRYAINLRHSIAISHFAIARSSGIKTHRSWFAVVKHLALALMFSPTELFTQIKLSL
jgi:glycosyltransferase involved in cell wall biosynthesis